jgi:hypothetical protein
MSVVKVNVGVVLNIGNYQSLRLDLGMEDTVREGETQEEAMDRVYAFVENSIEAKIATAKKDF